MFDPRAIPCRPMIDVLLTPSELHQVIRWLEKKAAEAERDGHVVAADLLGWRAVTLREAAR
jgi:hypothetical protein